MTVESELLAGMEEVARALERKGLLERVDGRMRATDLGMLAYPVLAAVTSLQDRSYFDKMEAAIHALGEQAKAQS